MNLDYMKQMFGLGGQVGVVIGGNGTLGSAMCRAAAMAGAHVVVSGRKAEKAQPVVSEIAAAGGSAQLMVCDTTQRESLEAMRKALVHEHGKIDFLINCAGVNSPTPFLEIQDDEWDRIITANLTGVKTACQVFIPQMIAQSGGRIINVASITSLLPLSRVFTYSTSKAGVLNLTQNLGAEFAPQSVRVNAIVPGFFPAEQNRAVLDETRRENILRGTPMGRFGEPQDLEGATVFLLSAASNFVTGEAVTVAGGFGARWF